MAKMVKLERCLDCKYQLVKNHNDRVCNICDLMDMEIFKLNSIPDWCPLPDYVGD